jgi:hypothetical protein
MLASPLLPSELPNDPWNEKREDEENQGEKNFKGEQPTPITARPYLLEGPYKKSKDERSDQDTQSRSQEIVAKTHLRQSHPKVHGCEWEIDEAQIEDRGKSVPFNGIVIFLEAITNQRGSEFSAEGTPNPKGGTRSNHGSNPDIYKSPIGAKKSSSQSSEKSARYKQTDPCCVYQHKDEGSPKACGLEEIAEGFACEKCLDLCETDDEDSDDHKEDEQESFHHGSPADSLRSSANVSHVLFFLTFSNSNFSPLGRLCRNDSPGDEGITWAPSFLSRREESL